MNEHSSEERLTIPSVDIHRGCINSPLGDLRYSITDDAISSLEFLDETVTTDRELKSALALELEQQLTAYFSGALDQFDIPLAPAGTPFQRRVWELLVDIPWARTISYQELAMRYGDLKAIRAIAAANGANPIAILIPCHRVIGSDGSLTGYAGGLWRKERLLELESGVQRLF